MFFEEDYRINMGLKPGVHYLRLRLLRVVIHYCNYGN